MYPAKAAERVSEPLQPWRLQLNHREEQHL